jgi:hypothetical protein
LSGRARRAIERACERAFAVVAFTEEARDRFALLAGAALASRAVVVPQAVALPESDDCGDGDDAGVEDGAGAGADAGADGAGAGADAGADGPSSLRATLGLGADALPLLLVCGLRAVKAPLFVAEAVARWHAEDTRVCLVVVGPPLEPAIAQAVWERTGAAAGAATGGGIILGFVIRARSRHDFSGGAAAGQSGHRRGGVG